MKPCVSVAVIGAAIGWHITSAAIAEAQSTRSDVVTATISGLVPVPVGPLIDNRGVGIGGTALLRYAPITSSPLAVRAELSGLLPSSHDNGLPDVTPHIINGSSALFATAGPEFDIPDPNGHFYTIATAGVAHLWASSAASNPWQTPEYGPYYTWTGRQATNFAWSAGGGFATRRFLSGLAADVGVRYYDLGRATYTTLYPSVEIGPGKPTSAFTTTGRHQTTFVAPSIGLSWTP